MSTPTRIQRRRSAGWRAPEGVVYVGRPTRWGNPFDWQRHGHEGAVALFRRHLLGSDALMATVKRELRGKDLMCWCPPDKPCHADVLLEVANS